MDVGYVVSVRGSLLGEPILNGVYKTPKEAILELYSVIEFLQDHFGSPFIPVRELSFEKGELHDVTLEGIVVYGGKLKKFPSQLIYGEVGSVPLGENINFEDAKKPHKNLNLFQREVLIGASRLFELSNEGKLNDVIETLLSVSDNTNENVEKIRVVGLEHEEDKEFNEIVDKWEAGNLPPKKLIDDFKERLFKID